MHNYQYITSENKLLNILFSVIIIFFLFGFFETATSLHSISPKKFIMTIKGSAAEVAAFNIYIRFIIISTKIDHIGNHESDRSQTESKSRSVIQ